jgi:hypothetical protein
MRNHETLGGVVSERSQRPDAHPARLSYVLISADQAISPF